MLLSFLIASVSATAKTPVISGQNRPSPMPIINRCGADGAMDHVFVVTLKPPPRPDSNGRRLDTTEKGSSTIGETLSTPTRAPCPENILTAWHLHAWAAGGTSSRLGWVVYPSVGL